MKIEGKGPTEAPEGRRFSASKALLKEGGKSFAAEFKKAAVPANQGQQAKPEKALPEIVSNGEGAEVSQSATIQEKASPAKANGKANPKDESDSFEDHMALVKLRVQSGFYTSKTVDDALSDRLTGFFDELA